MEKHGFRLYQIYVWREKSCDRNQFTNKESAYYTCTYKHPLITTDIFLFNIGKSVDTLTQINYDMLEGIKDGELSSSKYDSQRITVNTPNILMFF